MKQRGEASLFTSLVLVALLAGAMVYATVLEHNELRGFVDRMSSPVVMSVMLADSVSGDRMARAEALIRKVEGVENVYLITKDQAMSEFAASVGHKLQLGITLPASFEVSYRGNGAVSARLISQFSQIEGVREVLCDPTLASRHEKLVGQIDLCWRVLLGVVGAVMLVLLYLVIGAWVRRNSDRVDLVQRGAVAGVVTGAVAGLALVVADQFMLTDMPQVGLGLELSLMLASMVVVGSTAVAALFSYMSLKSL